MRAVEIPLQQDRLPGRKVVPAGKHTDSSGFVVSVGLSDLGTAPASSAVLCKTQAWAARCLGHRASQRVMDR